MSQRTPPSLQSSSLLTGPPPALQVGPADPEPVPEPRAAAGDASRLGEPLREAHQLGAVVPERVARHGGYPVQKTALPGQSAGQVSCSGAGFVSDVRGWYGVSCHATPCAQSESSRLEMLGLARYVIDTGEAECWEFFRVWSVCRK